MIVSILLLIASFSYYKCRDILAPTVLSPACWGIILLLYNILDHGMYEISLKTKFIILTWNIVLWCSAAFFSKVNIRKKDRGIHHIYINTTIQKLYWIITIIGTPFLLYIAYKQGVTGDSDFLFNLRMANTGIVESKYQYGIFAYIIPIAYVLLICEMLQYQKGQRRLHLFVIIILNVLFAFITMAKSSFLFTFGSCIIILFIKGRISLRQVCIGGLGLVALMSSIQLLRSSDNNVNTVISDMFYTYIFGGLPAFDQIVEADTHSAVPAQFSTSFLRAVGDKLGVIEHVDIPQYSPDIFAKNGYLFVPMPTNVYTTVAPGWMDGGYIGISFFATVIGACAGIFYRLAKKGKTVGVLLYPYMVCVLVLQFFSEYIFNNFSYFLQLILFVYLLSSSSFDSNKYATHDL